MNERIREIALRFFEGTITAEEECELYGFLNGNPQGLAQMREWESCWKRDHVPPADVLDSLDSLRRKIRRRRPLRRLWLRISAAAAVLALVSTLVLHLLPAERPEQLFTVEAPQGTHSRISLPDGTQVWLNAGSALSYGSSFNETSREVSLSGEAYFEVARHAALPFRVEARGCTFTVLGTKFDISAYAEDPAVTAALLEGALRFESEDKQEAMTPGDLVTYDCATATVRREQVDVRAVPGMDRRGDPLRRHYVAVAAQEAGPRVRRGDRSAHAQVRRYDVPHLALVRPKYQIGHAGAVRHPAHFGLVRRLPLCGGRPAAVMPPLRSN